MREQEQATGALARSLKHSEGGDGSVCWVGGVAEVVCPPPWWCCVQRSCAVPCFCSQHIGTLEGQLGLAFLYLVHNLPQLRMHTDILVPIVSLYSVARGDVCPGASTAAKAPGPRSQPVSVQPEKATF